MVTVFPANPIPVKTEILLNGVWTDISTYVQQRNSISMTGLGRDNWTSTIQASQVTLTLNNRDGRFTPKNASGAYSPYILRNTQIRISINAAQSSTGVSYSGYRFWGEISEWPPLWDESGHDVYCSITASGIWRRISQSTGPGNGNNIGSPFRRYIRNLTGSLVPASYWSLEDGGGSTAFVTSVGAGANGAFVGDPSFSSDGTSFAGSDSIPQFNGSRINMSVSGGGTPTNNVIWFLLSVPKVGDSQQGQNDWCILEAQTGSVALPYLEVYISSLPGSVGKLKIQCRTTPVTGTIRFQATTTNSVRGIPLLVSVELTPSAGNVNWALRLIRPGDGSVWESKTGTYNTATIGAISNIKLNRYGKLSDTAIGHVGAFYAVPSLTSAATALTGWNGETASARFTRLCTEFGIANEITGLSPAQMGPQRDDTFVNLLQEIEDTDGGLLYESRAAFALGYRTLASLKDQAVALSLNYATAQVSPPIAPAFDDQLVKNQITATNWTGYTMVATLNTGAVSVAQPPAGVGLYADSKDINAYADGQASTIATQELFNGTVDDLRYPGVTVQLARPEVAALFATIPGMRIGDRLQVPNMPAFMGGGTLDQLAWGYTETISNFTWDISFNTIAAAPYIAGFNPGAYTVVRAPSSSPGTGASGSVTGAMLSRGAVGIPELSSTVTSRTIGGNTSYTDASMPYSWTFALSVVPADTTYFVCYQDQAQTIAVGDTFTNSSGFGGPFTVTSISAADASGNVNVYFSPYASGAMSSGTVTGSKNGDLWINTGADNKLYRWQDGTWTLYQFGPSALSFTAGGTKVTIANSAPGSPSTGDVWFDGANGYEMKSWTGAAWTPFQFGATSISDNAITTPKLNAGAVVASKIAAGTVFAGIVDSTSVEGAYFISGAGGGTAWQGATPSVPGYYLYWDDGVSNPAIIFAVSAAAGYDQWGNTWQGGTTFVGLAILLNVLTVENPAGDALLTIDYAGNIQANTVSANDMYVGGESVAALIDTAPYGVVNYGWKAIGATAWPATPVGTTETSLLELDYDAPAGRVIEFKMDSTIVNATAVGRMHMKCHFTSDGSTPTTSSGEISNAAQDITATGADSPIGPLSSGLIYTGLAGGTYRFLVSAYVNSGTFQFKNDDYLRCYVFDHGAWPYSNNLMVLGSGTGGGNSPQSHTKTYYCTSSYSYYGGTASYGSGSNGLKSSNSTMYQGAASGYINGTGDQYSFARFNWNQIASDLSGATINWVKVRLTNLHSWYNSGCYVILGTTTFNGAFGDPFVPGAGTVFNRVSYWINEGQTLTKDVTGNGIGSGFQSGGVTALSIGRSADRTNSTDLNNYGYFFGYSASNHSSCPALTINYTK